MYMRFSSVLNFKNNQWKVIHWHGSKPEAVESKKDTWGIDIWKQKTKELERLVAEKTADLVKKNRELGIETALERVRVAGMTMHHTNEFSNVAVVLFDQLKSLGINPQWCWFAIINDKEKNTDIWYTEYGGRFNANPSSQSFNDPEAKGFVKAWKEKQPYYSYELKGKSLSRYISILGSDSSFKKSSSYKILMSNRNGCLTVNHSFFRFGALGFSTFAKCDKNILLDLGRFAKTFEQTYTRFLDLQKAESQTREAEISLALERVRARTLAMQRSEELIEASLELWKQVEHLGIPAFACGFNIWDPNKKFATAWMGGVDRTQPPFKTDSSKDIYKRIYEAEQLGKSLFVEEQEGENLKKHYEYLTSIPVFKEIANELSKKGIPFPDFQILHCCFFAQGYLMFITFEPVPWAYDIFLRFATVFEQTYTRFLDLKKAEEQAREAQIEVALERIRAKVTSMQESTDLLDIMVNIRSEFVSLGHEAHYFWYMRWLPNKYEKAMTSGDGSQVGMIMTLPRHIHGEIPLVADWEQGDKPTLIFPMEVNTAVDYVDKMITLGDFELVDPHAPTLDDIRHIGGLTFVMARTTHGEIGYSLPGEVPNPPKEAVNTLTRFAGVFDLAYKRFEDIKKAEKDLVEIKEAKKKAEETLSELKATQTQLIQQEKLASLGQLTAGIAHEIKNPLNFVNNFSEISIELIEEIRVEMAKKPEARDESLVEEIMEDVKSNIQKVHEHGSRANSVVTSMLQHSRGGSGKMEPINLNSIVKEYVNLAFHGMRAGKEPINVDIDLDLNESIGEIPMVAEDFSRVILNLCNNAFDAMREKIRKKSIVNCQKKEVYNPKLTVHTKSENGLISIGIEDNGPGIPDEIKDKILQPFFTTKKGTQGTGLGLSITNDIVKAHRGEIKVDSIDGEGTIFYIHLKSTE